MLRTAQAVRAGIVVAFGVPLIAVGLAPRHAQSTASRTVLVSAVDTDNVPVNYSVPDNYKPTDRVAVSSTRKGLSVPALSR